MGVAGQQQEACGQWSAGIGEYRAPGGTEEDCQSHVQTWKVLGGLLRLDEWKQLGTGPGMPRNKARRRKGPGKRQDFQSHIPKGKQGPPGEWAPLPGPCGSSQRQSLLESPPAAPKLKGLSPWRAAGKRPPGSAITHVSTSKRKHSKETRSISVTTWK